MNNFFQSVATTLSSTFSGSTTPQSENSPHSNLIEKPTEIEIATEMDRIALDTPTTQSDFSTYHQTSPSPNLDLRNITSLTPVESPLRGTTPSEAIASSASFPEGFPLFTREELTQLEAGASVDKMYPQSKEGIRTASSYRLIGDMSAETIMAHICNPKNIRPLLPHCSAASVIQSETDKNGLIVSFIAKCIFHAPPPHTDKTKEVELAFKLTPTPQGYSFALTPITPSPYVKNCKIEVIVASHQGRALMSHTVSLRLELPMFLFWVPNSMINDTMLKMNRKTLSDIVTTVSSTKTNPSVIDPFIVDSLLRLHTDAQDTSGC